MRFLLRSLCLAALMVGGASAQPAPAPKADGQVADQAAPTPDKGRPPLPERHAGPGEHDDGDHDMDGGPRMHGPMPTKAAVFHIEAGPAIIDVKCPDDEAFKACADVVKELVDKALAPPLPPAPEETN